MIPGTPDSMTPFPERPSVALRAALAQAEVDGDLSGQNQLLGRLGRALLSEDETLPALACFEQGLKVAQQLDDKESGARHLANQGTALGQIGNYTLAMRAFRKSYTFAKELAHEPMEYDLLLLMAELERARKSPESAIGHLDEALILAQRHGSAGRALRVHLAYGQASWDLDEVETAIEHYEIALALAREVGDLTAQGHCLNTLGGLARANRDIRKASSMFEQALALSPTAHSSGQRLALLAQLGDIRFGQGVLDESRQLFAEALTVAREIGDRESETRLVGSLGLVSADLGDPDEALNLAAQAVELARAIGEPRLHGEQLLFQALALADVGQTEAALTACEAAITFFEEIEASSLIQKAYDLQARLTAADTD